MSIGVSASQAMALACDTWSLGYSQPKRLDIRDGGSADCSSLVAWAYNRAGITPAFPSSTWTGSIAAAARARGFRLIPWTPGAALQTGDALLAPGHVALYTGSGMLREAWASERGSIDGASGDQTGGETRAVTYTRHPMTLARRWITILRPPADTTTTTTVPEEDTAMRIIHTTTPWGADAWAEITEHAGADGLDRLGCAIEQKVWGAPHEVTWDEYNWHVRRAWERAARVANLSAEETAKRIAATIPTQPEA